MQHSLRFTRIGFVCLSLIAVMLAGFAAGTGSNAAFAAEGPIRTKLRTNPETSRALIQSMINQIEEDDSIVIQRDGLMRVTVELMADSTSVTFVRQNNGRAPGAATAIRSQAGIITSQQNQFVSLLAAFNIQARETSRLTVTVNAVTIEIARKDLGRLAKVPGIKSITPVKRVDRELTSSVSNIGVPTVWNYGLTGFGMRVAIIDDGINYQHADFGGTATTVFTPGVGAGPVVAGVATKVVGGYDLVGDVYDARIVSGTGSAPTPDADPFTCPLTGTPPPIFNPADTPIHHGTHVAGIAVGYGVTTASATYTGPWNGTTFSSAFNIGPGVAPNSTMLSYRVFGCYGSTTSEIVAQAIDKAVDPNGDTNPADHVDVINMSLGSGYGNGFGAYQVSVDNATNVGVVVVASAGNSADTYFVTGDPAATGSAISVAGTAAYNPQLFVPGGAAAGTYYGTGAAFGPLFNATGVTSNAVLAAPVLACTALTNGGAITGNIAVVDRGTCSFKTKVLNAQNAGAVAVVVCNNAAGAPIPMGDDATITTPITIPAIMLSQSDCTTKIKPNLPITNATARLTVGGTSIYGSTSRGPRSKTPLGDMILKPDIAAPGSSVISAFGGSLTAAANYSGTSMAAPHIAGVAALLKAQNPTWNAKELKALIMNSGIDDIPLVIGQATLYGMGRVGTGKINVPNAANLPAGPAVIAYDKLHPELVSLSFGQIDAVGTTIVAHDIELKNKGATGITYTVTVNPVVSQQGTTVSVSPGSVTVPPGGTAIVTVTVTADPDSVTSPLNHDPTVAETQGGLPREWLAEVTGHVKFQPTSGAVLRVAYHAAVRPVSEMTVSNAVNPISGPTGNLDLNLTGNDFQSGNPAAGGAGYLYQVSPVVSPFWLKYKNPNPPSVLGPLAKSADVEYVGVSSDYAAQGGDLANTTVFFAIVTRGDFSTQNVVGPIITIYGDPADTTAVTRVVYSPKLAVGNQPTDLFLSSYKASITTPGTGTLWDFTSPVYGAGSTPLQSYRFNSNVLVLAAPASVLVGVSGEPFLFDVQIESYDLDVALGPTPKLSYSPEADAFDFTDPTGSVGGPFVGLPWYDDFSSFTVPVAYDLTNAGYQSQQVLLVHYHNKTAETRGEVVDLNLAATATPTATTTATPTATATPSSTPLPLTPDTIGAFNNGTFYLRNSNTTGPADIVAAFGVGTDLPVVGDWDGNGIDTIGVYRGSTGQYFLSNSNTSPSVAFGLTFGNPGDTPLAGKWDNTMTTSGVGVYRNSNGILYLRKTLTTGFADYAMIYGNPGDQGVAGDWNNDGFDSVGVYRSADQKWYLTNTNTNGVTFADLNFSYNILTNAPVVGDWDGDIDSTPGYLTAAGAFVLHPANATAGTDIAFAFGPTGSKPIAGKWAAVVGPGRVNIIGGGGKPSVIYTPEGSNNKVD